MIPDKIYLSTGTVSSNIPGERYALPGWHEKPNPKMTNEEYIRKNVLLKWLKEKHDNTDNMDVRISMTMIIDKLQSM